MQFEAVLHSCIRRWGQTVRLDTPEGPGAPYRAFLQPLGYKNKMYLEGTQTGLGLATEDYTQYLGPASPSLQNRGPAARLVAEDASYTIRHSELITLGEGALYCRAVLKRVWEEESDEAAGG